MPLALALLAGAYLLFGAGDGLVIGADGARRAPALVELAQGPLLVLSLGAVGVLLGRVAPVAPLGADAGRRGRLRRGAARGVDAGHAAGAGPCRWSTT